MSSGTGPGRVAIKSLSRLSPDVAMRRGCAHDVSPADARDPARHPSCTARLETMGPRLSGAARARRAAQVSRPCVSLDVSILSAVRHDFVHELLYAEAHLILMYSTETGRVSGA